MLIKKILSKIDHALCCYLGLHKEKICPDTVQMFGNRLLIISTTSFKRHYEKASWERFGSSEFYQLSQENQEKLGIAAGKAIAKELSISFEKTTIKKEKE